MDLGDAPVATFDAATVAMTRSDRASLCGCACAGLAADIEELRRSAHDHAHGGAFGMELPPPGSQYLRS